MDLHKSLEAFRDLPYFRELAGALRTKLNIPENYAELEQQGKLSCSQVQSLIVYRLLTQEAL